MSVTDPGPVNDTLSMLEFIAEHTNDVIVRMDRRGIVSYVSPSLRNFGFEPADVIGTTGLHLIHPEDVPRFAVNTSALLRGEVIDTVNREHRLNQAGDDVRWVEGNPRVIRDATGEVTEIVTVFRDVTQRRAAEEALRESEARYRIIAEKMTDLVVQTDLDGVFTYVSPSIRAYGYQPEDLLGSRGIDLLHPDDAAKVLENRERALDGLPPLPERDRQNRFRTASGDWAWLEGSPLVLRGADGDATGVMNVLRDVTDRRVQSDLFEAAFNNAPVLMVLTSMDHKILRVNPEACRLLGYPEAEFLNLKASDLAHPDEYDLNAADARRLKAGEIDSYTCQRRYRRADGEYIWLEFAVALVRHADGKPKHYISYAQDLTARRAAEAALRESEARYRLIAQNMTDVVVQADLDGIMTYVSPSVSVYGFEPGEMVGQHWSQFAHPDDKANLGANLDEVISRRRAPTMERRQNRFRTKSGEWVWLEGSPRVLFGPNGAPVGTLDVLRNVTERRAQAELFQTAFANAPVAMTLARLDGRIFQVNAAVCRILGYAEAELLGMGSADLLHPDEIPGLLETRERLLSGEIDSYECERRFIRGDGSPVWAHLAVSLVRNADGSPKNFVSLAQDLTARHADAAALRDSEARYRLIAEKMSDIIAVSNAQGLLTYVSPSVAQLGFVPETLLGKTFSPHVEPGDAKHIQESLRAQSPGGESKRIRWRCRHQGTGEWVWMESAPTRLWDPETNEPAGYLDVVREISTQVRQEEALATARAEAEAAASIKSQFLANMSHEIRTPLTAVLGYTDILAATPSLSDDVRAHVQRIGGAGSALLAIVNDILDFSKLEAGMVEVRPRPSDVAKIAEETLLLFEARAAEKALELYLELPEELPSALMLDPDRLRQILVNLTGNAVKFTDEGSITLRIATREDGALGFEVEDTGCGLDADQCARLFQRFNQIDGSTTRQHGGTGLGLAISKGLAEAMGGQISVRSQPGKGSIFQVILPAPLATEAAPAAVEADVASITGARILVADDNAVNRELARRILEAFGAVVSEAEDGARALAILGDTPVDLVLMDLRMPTMDGREALQRLRETPGPNRAAPVLAFTADAVGDGTALDAFDGVVRKPIDAMHLALQIAEATARAATNPPAGEGERGRIAEQTA